ncbi:MAG: hypothetical protein HOY78_24195 [Saccharothrix sp.]|nr:hypothetical protein [Saccharothrix sp.]
MTAHDVARRLPPIPELRMLCRALAVLDIVLNPDSEHRYHAFDTEWAPGEQLASMRDGAGNEYDIVFTAAGAYVRGFDHESPMSPYATDDEPWPGVLDTVPDIFRDCVEEPAFSDEYGTPYVTVCLWREHDDTTWRHGDITFPDGNHDHDGADWLFALLTDPTPEAYREWAQDYHGKPVDLDAVRHVYTGQPLTTETVTALNPTTTLAAITDRLAATGYPIHRP